MSGLFRALSRLDERGNVQPDHLAPGLLPAIALKYHVLVIHRCGVFS
jgi:hypothetical protein